MSEIKKERLVVFDFIRVVAILLVVLSHTLRVDADISWGWKYEMLGALGNCLFFFISGYLIYLNNSRMNSKRAIFQFYKKRVLRIYPLYILAILTSIIVSYFIGGVIVFGDIKSISAVEIIISMLGLQLIFAPKYISGEILWFIGMIVILYLIYPIILYMSKNNLCRFFILSCITIGLFAIIRAFSGFIGGNMFEYYFVFIAGVIASWINIFKTRYINLITAISSLLFIVCMIIKWFYHPSFEGVSFSSSIIVPFGIHILLRIISGISAVFILYYLYNLIRPNIFFNNLIINGAFAAYAVYLFHGSFFSIINKCIVSFGGIISDVLSNPIVYDILLIGIFIPVIFIIGYFLQKGENICIKKIKMKFSAKH